MTHKIDIRGVLIPNEYKKYYEYFDMDATCPKDISKIINVLEDGDEVEVYINSPGGVIDVGTEIYTLLRQCKNKVQIYITGEACSAASVIAMSAYCEMAPTALMMVHCTSTETQGNHNEMEKTADTLRTADRAICQAYVLKSGMSQTDALTMMEEETWLTAEQAKEKGLIDAIMFDDGKDANYVIAAGTLFKLPTDEQLNKVKNITMEKAESTIDCENAFEIIKTKYNFLKKKGEKR